MLGRRSQVERLPALLDARRRPQRVRVDHQPVGGAAAAQRNDALAADDLHAVALVHAGAVALRVEESRHPAGEGDVAVDAVAGHRPQRLGGLVHVRRLDGAPVHGNVRGHPQGIAGQVLHQVEQVDAQVHHVLAAAAVVVLAVRVQLLQPPDAPAVDQRLQAVHARQVCAVKVPYGDLDARRRGRRDHAVAILQADRQRLLAVHVAAGINARQHHLQALVEPARTHADQIQFLARQHLAVVGIAAQCLRLRAARVPGPRGRDRPPRSSRRRRRRERRGADRDRSRRRRCRR